MGPKKVYYYCYSNRRFNEIYGTAYVGIRWTRANTWLMITCAALMTVFASQSPAHRSRTHCFEQMSESPVSLSEITLKRRARHCDQQNYSKWAKIYDFNDCRLTRPPSGYTVYKMHTKRRADRLSSAASLLPLVPWSLSMQTCKRMWCSNENHSKRSLSGMRRGRNTVCLSLYACVRMWVWV